MASYVITPRKEQLEALRSYFAELAQQQGNDGTVEFTHQSVMEAEPGKYIKSMSYVSSLMSFLEDQGLAKRLRRGTSVAPNKWDVANFLKQGVPSGLKSVSEPIGPHKHVVDVKDGEKQTQLKINLTSEQPIKVEEPAPVPTQQNNAGAIAQLQSSITEMTGYLEALPKDIISELRRLSQGLEYADHDIITQLTKEKKDLEDEVTSLKQELEQTKASVSPSYSEHHIYRQRNLILDEVHRMLNTPAWKARQNKQHYIGSITEKLDKIMTELNIKED